MLLLPLLVALAGCQQPAADLRGRLHILIETQDDVGLSYQQRQDNEATVRLIQREFNKLHPELAVTVSLAPEKALDALLQQRRAMGLGPDLLLVSGFTAMRLHAQGLSSSIHLPEVLLGQLDRTAVQRLRQPGGGMLGVPLAIYPDLACFDRQDLAESPRTLSEWLQLEQRGLESGLAIEGRHLLWTAGALGADKALAALLNGAPVTAEHRAAIAGWLAWLRRSNHVTGIYFVNSMSQLVDGLQDGRLDWIVCNSLSLPRLRKALGERLGVALLPSGPGGPASQLARQLMWVMSPPSDERQRKLAQAWMRFSVNAPMQAAFSLSSTNSLPVNTAVAPQVNHQDPIVRSMVLAGLRSRDSMALAVAVTRHKQRLDRLNELLRLIIDGELELEEGTAQFIEALRPEER